jgi:hypothetical protein
LGSFRLVAGACPRYEARSYRQLGVWTAGESHGHEDRDHSLLRANRAAAPYPPALPATTAATRATMRAAWPSSDGRASWDFRSKMRANCWTLPSIERGHVRRSMRLLRASSPQPRRKLPRSSDCAPNCARRSPPAKAGASPNAKSSGLYHRAGLPPARPIEAFGPLCGEVRNGRVGSRRGSGFE